MSSIGRLKALSFAAATVLAFGSADAGTLDKVRQDKALRIAFREDAPPFSFTDSTGLPAGFMIDLCRSVAKHIGEQLNISDLKVNYVLVTAANRFDAIENGKADLLCEPTSETLSRREHVDFSIPTSSMGRACSSAATAPPTSAPSRARRLAFWPERRPRRACATPWRAPILRRKSCLRRRTSTGSPCSTRERSSPISPIARSFPISPPKAATSSKLRLADNYFSLEPYALALPHGDEDFRLAVDRALSHIYRSGEIAVVFAHTFGNAMQPSDTLKTLYSVSALPD